MQNNKSNIKNVTLAGLFLAVGIVMPKLFHLVGAQAGSMFLPLFFGVAIAALILPLKFAIAVAVLTPIISNLISGMPAVPILFFMLIELVAYAVIVQILHKKVGPVISIAGGLLLSRTVYISAVLVAVKILHLPVPFVSFSALVIGVLKSAPGIALQIVIIPAIYHIYKKRGAE